MKVNLSVRNLLSIAVLTGAWCALWRTVSVANVLSGFVVSSVVISSGTGTPGRGSIRFVPLLRLIAVVFTDLIRSTINVAYEVLTPTDYTNESIIAVELPPGARHHLLLLVLAITLTPGTAVVDADPDDGTLFLHLLHADRTAETVDHVERLAHLACEALPLRSTRQLSEAS